MEKQYFISDSQFN